MPVNGGIPLTISQLPSFTQALGSSIIPVTQGTVTGSLTLALIMTGYPASTSIVGTELVTNLVSGTNLQTTSISQLITQSAASSTIAGTELILQSPGVGSVKKTTIAQLITQANAGSTLVGTESLATVTAGGAYQKTTIAQVVAAAQQQPPNARNYFADPSCRVAQGASGLALSTSYQYGQVDLVQHKATGTAVSAGTLNQNGTMTAPAVTGFCSEITNATITGAGIVFARRWLEALDAESISGPGFTSTCTFSCVVLHNVGSTINYTITINRANSTNNFGAVTNVGTSGNIAVPTGVPTLISFTLPMVAGVANGIEMIVQASCGAVTTKTFDWTDWQAVQGSVVFPLQLPIFSEEFAKVQRYFQKSYSYGTAAGAVATQGQNTSVPEGTNWFMNILFRIGMVSQPTIVLYSPATGATGNWRDVTGAADVAMNAANAIGTNAAQVTTSGVSTANHQYAGHWTADARF